MSMTPAQFWQIEMQNRGQQQGQQQQMMQAVAGLAQSYADGKAKDAKASAYGEFLGMHGPSLGLQPEWLEEFRKKPPEEQLAIGDILVGSYLPQVATDGVSGTGRRSCIPVAVAAARGGVPAWGIMCGARLDGAIIWIIEYLCAEHGL
jgi:hypothetical protein